MKIEKFEDIIAWQKSRALNRFIYKFFNNVKDFSFRDQITRASISIGNNIAEGFERRTNKELRTFLFISKGSCGEVRSMLYFGYDLKYINKEDFIVCYELTIEISKMLSGFIKTL
jgi:four helix bundle protein